MAIDFFNDSCQNKGLTHTKCGICDGENNEIAYIDLKNQEEWIAIIQNDKQKPFDFTAIDHCIIIYDDKGNQKKTCDAMLVCQKSLFVIELKNKRKRWLSNSIEQLKSTISALKEFHHEEINCLEEKKAFACNKKHPCFNTVNSARKKEFLDNTGFTLHTKQIIKIS